MEFTISPALFKAFGDTLAGAKSRISPFTFRFFDEGEASEASDEALRRLGLLDEYGEAPVQVRRILEILAMSRSFTRVQFTGTPELFEYFVYSDPGGEEPVSLAVTAGGLRVSDPAATGEVLAFLKDCTGESALTGCGLDADLPVREALVLAACLDLQRKAAWRAILESAPLEKESFEASQVHSEVTGKPKPVSQWFLPVVCSLLTGLPTLSASDVQESLENLVTKGYLSRTDKESRYCLGEETFVLGGRMILIHSILKLQSAVENDRGEVTCSEAVCLQSGVFDLLYLEAAEGAVRMRCISSAELNRYLEIAFRNSLRWTGPSVESQPAAATGSPETTAAVLAANTNAREPEDTASPAAAPSLPRGIADPAPFLDLAARHASLRAQLDSGAMPPEVFQAELHQLRFQDASGTWWQIDAGGLHWLKWDGGAWVKAQD